MQWNAAINLQIRKADRLARQHGRPFYVLSAGTAILPPHDSADRINETTAITHCVQAVVYPDGSMSAGGRRQFTDLAYPGERGRLAGLHAAGLDPDPPKRPRTWPPED
jgi:hypothetical protein